MPRCIVPHVSSAHRVACLSLYRALLKQSSSLQIACRHEDSHSKSSQTLSNLVRFRFRQDCKLQSPTQIINGLKAGYAALDLVHSCNNNSATVLTQLRSLLESTASQAKYTTAYRAALAASRSPTSPQKLSKIAHLRAVATKANATRYPGSKPVLDRPLPLSEIKSGKRRVPNLISAQGVPFLRYSKPQPISLSRVIRQKQERHQKMLDKQEDLKAGAAIAGWEDEWDEIVEHQIVEEQHQFQGKRKATQEDGEAATKDGVREQSWRYEVDLAKGEVYQQMKDADRKNAEMGRRMWEVVVKERELAAQEKREAKIQRRIERKAAAAAATAAT